MRQNYAHTQAIKSILKESYGNINVYGYVAFLSAGKLKISETNNVGYLRGVVRMIKKHQDKILSDEDKEKICSLLKESNIIDKHLRKKHIKDIRVKR